MAVRSALRAERLLPLGRLLVLIADRDWLDSRAIVRLEWLGKLKIHELPQSEHAMSVPRIELSTSVIQINSDTATETRLLLVQAKTKTLDDQ
jgi:hypothetical protein